VGPLENLQAVDGRRERVEALPVESLVLRVELGELLQVFERGLQVGENLRV